MKELYNTTLEELIEYEHDAYYENYPHFIGRDGMDNYGYIRRYLSQYKMLKTLKSKNVFYQTWFQFRWTPEWDKCVVRDATEYIIKKYDIKPYDHDFKYNHSIIHKENIKRVDAIKPLLHEKELCKLILTYFNLDASM